MKGSRQRTIAATSAMGGQGGAAAVLLAIALASSFTCSAAAFATTCHCWTPAGRSSTNHHQYLLNAARGQQELDDDFNAAFNDDGRAVGHDYHPEPNAGPISADCRFTEAQIHALLTKRMECKSLRKFEEADLILAGLNKNGVYVHDKRREWRADGQNHFGRQPSYVRRGGNYGLSDEDLVKVSAMVEDRSHAKRTKEYHRSDYLTDMLKQRYNVKVNDKKREWSVVVSDKTETNSNNDAIPGNMQYVPSPLAAPDDPTHTMDDESKAHVEQRLMDRMIARKKKKYGKADKIRDELMQEYSIVIDDRTKEYKVVDNMENDDFAREAQLSQRSAFIRRGEDSNKNSESTSTNPDDFIISEENDSPNHDDMTDVSPEAVVTDRAEEKGEVEEEVRQTEEELNGLTVVMLKEKLRRAGLRLSGTKSELIGRLIDNDPS